MQADLIINFSTFSLKLIIIFAGHWDEIFSTLSCIIHVWASGCCPAIDGYPVTSHLFSPCCQPERYEGFCLVFFPNMFPYRGCSSLLSPSRLNNAEEEAYLWTEY